MFAGITWGQFALYVGLAVVIYYVAVILVYYRAELAARLGKPRKSAPDQPRPPAAGAAQPFSPVGASTDYGHLLSPSLADPSPPAGQAFASPAHHHPAPLENENPADSSAAAAGTDTDPDDNWYKGVLPDDEPIAAVLEPEHGDMYMSGEIDVENEFIGFEPGQAQEVTDGGTSLESLERTIVLLNQEEITPAEKVELAPQVARLDGTHLLNTLMENYDRARARINLLTKEAAAGRGGEGPALLPASRSSREGKEAFADVDIDALIRKHG